DVAGEDRIGKRDHSIVAGGHGEPRTVGSVVEGDGAVDQGECAGFRGRAGREDVFFGVDFGIEDPAAAAGRALAGHPPVPQGRAVGAGWRCLRAPPQIAGWSPPPVLPVVVGVRVFSGPPPRFWGGTESPNGPLAVIRVSVTLAVPALNTPLPSPHTFSDTPRA